ncbi:MAG: hypothetical protein H0V82_10350 [Candidatus Protochlamydia sp.]|nr:hypothetical protein [Candidatus Protochlamydia sp.]
MKAILGLLGISMLAMNFVSANINESADKHFSAKSERSIEKNARCKKCRGGRK